MRRKKRPVRRFQSDVDLRDSAEKRLESYNLGVSEGYKLGAQAGFASYNDHFEGTSIIIPSCNELEALKRCLEAIMDHTDQYYEIIVIDNGSADGTDQFLKGLEGQVRFQILPERIGFAGAANRGFMMAKGNTIMLLNSGVVPCENWLDHMLACLLSDENIGLVSPMIRERGVEPLTATFVDSLNPEAGECEIDPAKWLAVEHLSGHCFLFRRELFERVGYMDEGCQASPYEVEDYCKRVRLLGHSLVIAGDASMYNASSRAFQEDTRVERGQVSEQYFKKKWSAHDDHDQSEHNYRMEPVTAYARRQDMSKFYPEQMVVKGLNGAIYWIVDGCRRPIQGDWPHHFTRLSQIDLWRWPIGEPIPASEIVRQGHVSTNGDGAIYYVEQGRIRRVINAFAAEAWGLLADSQSRLSETDLHTQPEGLPIIAPALIHQPL